MNSNSDFITENAGAIISAGAALVGAFFGWFLNWLSQRGKIKIFVSSWEEQLDRIDKSGIVLAKEKDADFRYMYDVILDIYNSSREAKIMRNIEISFNKKNTTLASFAPYTGAIYDAMYRKIRYDDITPINIPQQAVIQLKLNDYILLVSGNTGFIWDSNKVYLTYLNNKGKKKRVLLHVEEYRNRFKKQSQEAIKSGGN